MFELSSFRVSATEPIPGDRVRVSMGLYWHYGVYVGRGFVVEHAGKYGGLVQCISLRDFRRGRPSYQVLHHQNPSISREQVVEWAMSQVGSDGYDLFSWNCEHLANRAAFGRATSAQSSLLAIGLIAAALIAIKRFAPAGR